MGLVVLKFGGTSMTGAERIAAAADKILAERARGHDVIAVVSAMSGVTNDLIKQVETVDQNAVNIPDRDAVVATGEQVTSGLLAIELQKRGAPARAFHGGQVPIITDNSHGRARILSIPDKNLRSVLKSGVIPVIAGFQGVTREGRVTTLGRGGSDTSAVAVAAALNADRCDIYTDVDGVYSSDPRVVNGARKDKKISYEEMLELATLGAKVLMNRSVELAMKWRVPLQVLSSFAPGLGSDHPGTMIVDEKDILEQEVVSGIAFSRSEAKITLLHVADRPGIAASVFGPLADANINVDMIVQNISADGLSTDLTFTLPRGDANRAVQALHTMAGFDANALRTDLNVAKVSVVGIGMASHAGVARTMFKTLADHNINIQVIATSEIRISVLVDERQMDEAVRALHTAYGLDQNKDG